MKKIVFSFFFLLTFSVFAFGQQPVTRIEPVPGMKPFIPVPGYFENLDSPAQMDRYGNLTEKEKKAHLDRFIGIISAGNETVEYVILLNSKIPSEIVSNMEFVYKYLTVNKKVKPAKISFVIATDGQNDMELWLTPNTKVSVPTCQGCRVVPADDEEKLKKYFPLKKVK